MTFASGTSDGGLFRQVKGGRVEKPLGHDRHCALSASASQYSTSFPGAENPLSEGNQWTNGSAAGVGLWGDVQSAGGKAFGVSEPTVYGDPTAVLDGTWGPEQTVQATVKLNTAFGSCCHEAELRLRRPAGIGSPTTDRSPRRGTDTFLNDPEKDA